MSPNEIAKLALIVLVIITSLPIVCALGISPAKTTLDFEPNKETSVKLRILNNEHKNVQLVVYASGDLAETVSFEHNIILVSQNLSEKIVYANIKFPEKIEQPGTHQTDIIVLELPRKFLEEGGPVITEESSITLAETQSGALLTASTAVISKLYIKVPYPETYIESRMFISEAEVNQTVGFSFPVYNFAKQKLDSIKAVINIYTPLNERVARIETAPINLEPQKEGRLVAEWVANVHAGEYYAVATIYYADKKLELKKQFKVGNLYLAIEKIEVLDFSLGEIAKFNIFVENRWNNPVSNVYGEIQIFDLDGREHTKFKTASVDIKPGVVQKIVAYWDTTGVSVGEYDMKVLLHYAEKITEKITRIQVNIDSIQTELIPTGQIIAQKPTLKRDSILLFIILVLIIVNIAWFIYMKKSRKNA